MEIVEFYPKREIGGYNIDTIRIKAGMVNLTQQASFRIQEWVEI